MGRRHRHRDRLAAPDIEYHDENAGTLVLRARLGPSSRRRYEEVLGGGLDREDAWQRALEFLFERLAVSWTIAGVETARQRELLGRLRIASGEERQFVRRSIRAHAAEHFPELKVP